LELDYSDKFQQKGCLAQAGQALYFFALDARPRHSVVCAVVLSFHVKLRKPCLLRSLNISYSERMWKHEEKVYRGIISDCGNAVMHRMQRKRRSEGAGII
jgi:hypothetical protein